MTGIRDERAALIELKTRYGCAITGMTIGTDGAIVYCEGQFIESRGFKLGRMQNTTGAGDAFRGGFLYGLLRGDDIETSLRFGNAVAAMKCSALGARSALPTQAQLRNS